MFSFFLSTLIALDVTSGNKITPLENSHVLQPTNPIPTSFPANSTLPKSLLIKAEALRYPLNSDKVTNIRLTTWGEFSRLSGVKLIQTAEIAHARMIYEVTMLTYGYLEGVPNQDFVTQYAYDAETGIELAFASRRNH